MADLICHVLKQFSLILLHLFNTNFKTFLETIDSIIYLCHVI
uniref:Uncharacterized protein n=1 Tax=Manihot esculenta TaxID=3983 RepID=A0A2C9UF67_MANES